MIRAIIFWSKAITKVKYLRGGHENKPYVQDDPLGHLSEMRAAEFWFLVAVPKTLYFCDRFWSENDRSDHLPIKSDRAVPDKI